MRQHCRAGGAQSADELLAAAFKLRGFSKAQLLRYYSRFEDSIGEYRALRTARVEALRPAVAAERNAAGNSSSVAAPIAEEHVEALHSSLVSAEQLHTIWSWLPERIQLQRPSVVFTTDEHGYSLNSLYTRSDQYEPTLIVVRSARGAVFGAYCSSAWAERDARTAGGSGRHAGPSFFGTGESFVFTLAPIARVFKWVGVSHNDSVRQGSKRDKDLSHAFQLGMRDALSVGGCG